MCTFNFISLILRSFSLPLFPLSLYRAWLVMSLAGLIVLRWLYTMYSQRRGGGKKPDNFKFPAINPFVSGPRLSHDICNII